MTTSRASFLCLVACWAVGCELARDPGKRGASTETERTDEAPTIRSSAPASQASATAAVTTAREPATTPALPSPIPTREDWKSTAKKDDSSTVAPVDTRTVEGTVRALDVQRRLITINVPGQKSQTFPVDAKAPIEDLADQAHALKGGFAAIRPGASVLLAVYRNKSDREVVSLIRVKSMKK
jgi:hypothetical protein